MASREPLGGVKIVKTNIIKYVLIGLQISYPDRELTVNPSPSTPPRSEAEKIEQLRETSSREELQWAEWKIRALEERLRLELIRKYGPKSETLNDEQLLLLELEPGVSSAEVEAESTARAAAARVSDHCEEPDKPQTSGTAGTSGRSAARGTGDCLHAGTMRMQVLRQGNGGDRLRAERTTGRGAGAILRGGHQAREACLQGMCRRRERGATAGADHRQRTGE